MTDCIANVLAYKGSAVETATLDTTVSAAVEQMNARHIGSLVIVDRAHQPIGIFTERDVLVRVIGANRNPRETRVADVMTRVLVTVDLETTIEEAMQIVTDRRCRHLPVVERGELRGLVSAGDLTGWIVRTQQRTIYDLHDYIRAV